MMCLAIFSSFSLVGISLTTKIKSNLVSNGIGRFTFSVIFLKGSYFPYIGFAAAKIDVLALSVATIPPLAILADCCSITSCNALLSSGFILSNSSILTRPWSPSTTAPASSIMIPVLSRTTAAVRPAAVEPLPEVYNPLGAILEQNFSISDFAVPGSPTRNTFMSPLILLPSPNGR